MTRNRQTKARNKPMRTVPRSQQDLAAHEAFVAAAPAAPAATRVAAPTAQAAPAKVASAPRSGRTVGRQPPVARPASVAPPARKNSPRYANQRTQIKVSPKILASEKIRNGKLIPALRRHPGRVAAGVAGTALVGTGAAIAIDRHNHKKEADMSKNWVNPFEEVVVFGKAYPVKDVTRVRSGTPKTHTGRGVGHGQRLTAVRNSKGGGGHATKLERYTGGHSSARVGPFGKKLTSIGTGLSFKSAAQVRSGVSQVRNMPKATGIARNQGNVKGVFDRMPKAPSASLTPTRSIGAMPLGRH